jgi:RNA polymerase sigma factor (sigma-70 family)
MRVRGKEDDARKERFRRIWVTYFAKISAYALRRIDSAEDAADCLSETFAICWSKLEDVPENGDALYWLYGVAWRVIANSRRRTRRDVTLTQRLALELSRARHPNDDPANSSALEAFAALSTLNPEDQEILCLSSWEGLDTLGLSAVLGCSPGAARVRLHRARLRLAAEIDREEHVTIPAIRTSTESETNRQSKENRA